MSQEKQVLLYWLESLPVEARELREGIDRALDIADRDPEMALTRTRKVMEFIIRQVFEKDVGEDPGTRPLENLLQRLVKDEHLPRVIGAYANAVRELGNIATHDFAGDVAIEDVYRALEQLRPVVDWYVARQWPETRTPSPVPEGSPPPLSERLRAALEVSRRDCAERNVLYRTPHLLLALLRMSDSMAVECFDQAQAGLAHRLRAGLENYVTKVLPAQGAGHPYRPFEWEQHSIIQAAQQHAAGEESPAVSERHVLRAVLESSSRTVQQLRQSLGEETFEQVLKLSRTLRVISVPTPGFIFPAFDG